LEELQAQGRSRESGFKSPPERFWLRTYRAKNKQANNYRQLSPRLSRRQRLLFQSWRNAIVIEDYGWRRARNSAQTFAPILPQRSWYIVPEGDSQDCHLKRIGHW